MRWYAVCPVPVEFVLFSCVEHPVGILYVSVGPELRPVNCRTGNRVSWTIAACSFCDRLANVLSVS